MSVEGGRLAYDIFMSKLIDSFVMHQYIATLTYRTSYTSKVAFQLRYPINLKAFWPIVTHFNLKWIPSIAFVDALSTSKKVSDSYYHVNNV